MYGQSISGDIRIVVVILNKNEGQTILSAIHQNINTSPGTNGLKHMETLQHKSEKIYKSLYPETKPPELPPISEIEKKIDINSKFIVYFDLEKSGFNNSTDILQIVVAYENNTFSVIVKPTKAIPVEANNIHNLTFEKGNLHYKNKIVESVNLQEVLYQIFKFLENTKRRVTLAAHNYGFDSGLNSLKKGCMLNYYKCIGLPKLAN
ncbi:hypothetical protein TKK_0008810 [Trichogramma kaykai]